MLGEKVTIARWNGQLLPDGRNGLSPHSLRMRDRLTGTYIDITMQPMEPVIIETIWLDSPDFRSMSVNDQYDYSPGKIAYWEADGLPERKVLNVSGLRADFAETLRQVVLGGVGANGKTDPNVIDILSVSPDKKDSSMSMMFMVEYYKPFLKRVIEEEQRFRNRRDVIELCERTIEAIRAVE